MRLADWPREPFLNNELREWIVLQLRTLGVDDLAIYAVATGRNDETRRVLIATEVGLLDGQYVPRDTTARYALNVRLYPWQAVRAVDLRAETYRLWALEHQTRWRLRLARPSLETETEEPQLGTALAEFARACAVMADPAGAAGDPDDQAPAPGRLKVRIPERVPFPLEPERRPVGDEDPLGLRRPLSE